MIAGLSSTLWRKAARGGAGLALAGGLCIAPVRADVIPGPIWSVDVPARSRWDEHKLAKAEAIARANGSVAFMVVQDGRLVESWGDTAARLNSHSMRKSLLNALIGIAVRKGQIRLDDTLSTLQIDDLGGLTAEEKSATVLDLLEARSGIYHPAQYESPEMKAQRPARGSHAPGTFWYYNNWDFNALGAIYERATGVDIYTAFQREIAAPLQMRDFRARDTAMTALERFLHRDDKGSLYPPYPFLISARDLARFGVLYLNKGRWGDRQIVPADWIEASVRPASQTGDRSLVASGAGYGRLWWTGEGSHLLPGVVLPAEAFMAWGNGGHVLVVVPKLRLVFVHRASTNTTLWGVATQWLPHKPPGVPLPVVGAILQTVLEAAPK